MRLLNTLGMAQRHRRLAFVLLPVALVALWLRQPPVADAGQQQALAQASEGPLQLIVSTTLSMAPPQQPIVMPEASLKSLAGSGPGNNAVLSTIMTVTMPVVERMRSWLSEDDDEDSEEAMGLSSATLPRMGG